MGLRFFSNKAYALIAALALVLVVGIYSFLAGETASERPLFIPKSDILHESLQHIQRSYFDPERIKPQQMYETALNTVSNQIPPVLVNFQQNGQDFATTIQVEQATKEILFPPLENLSQLEQYLQEALQFIKLQLSSDELEDKRQVDYALVNGILSTLDPHSNLFTPEIYKDFTVEAQGSYGGVGMVISQGDGSIDVVNLIGDNPPAYKAGLKAGDKILQIDQFSTAGMDVEDAKNRLRGLKNSKVTLLVQRPNEKQTRQFVVIRDEIKLSSVQGHVFNESDNKRIGYVKISRVIGSTSAELEERLNGLSYNLTDFQGLILDLRNNPGGLLNEAIAVSNLFLSDGVIVSIAGVGKQNQTYYKARPYGTVKNFPIIVLVNRYSASASEIISAALQKNRRAILLGETTFGKGSVQTIVSNFLDGSALKLTTSQYLTTGNESIQSVGVVPDVVINKVVVREQLVQLINNPTSSERTLENSLQLSDATTAKRSRFQLDYLLSDGSADVVTSPYAMLDPEQLEQDYWVQSARAILTQTPDSRYDSLLTSAQKYLSQEQVAQSNNIQAAMQTLGVDWSGSAAVDNTAAKDQPSKPLQVSFQVQRQQAGQWQNFTDPFPADASGQIVVRVKNVTNRTFNKVLGVMKSDDPLFEGRQLVFGNMQPQEQMQWVVPFHTADFEIGRASLVQLTFLQYPEITIMEDVPVIVDIAPALSPKLRYTYQIDSSDGQVRIGEKQTLRVTLTNLSDIEVGSVSLVLKNADIDDLFLERGRWSIKDLKAKDTKTLNFPFELRSIPSDQEFNLMLSVFVEKYPLTSFSQKVSFAAQQPFAMQQNQSPEILFPRKKMTSSQKEFVFEADVFDDRGIKDIYVIHNDRKFFYQRFPNNGTKKYKVTVDYELTAQNNDFTVVVTDHNGVRSVNRKKILYQN